MVLSATPAFSPQSPPSPFKQALLPTQAFSFFPQLFPLRPLSIGLSGLSVQPQDGSSFLLQKESVFSVPTSAPALCTDYIGLNFPPVAQQCVVETIRAQMHPGKGP